MTINNQDEREALERVQEIIAEDPSAYAAVVTMHDLRVLARVHRTPVTPSVEDVAEGPRAFVLQRDIDETGVSGTGVVAEGVEFSDGVIALRWTSRFPTSVVFHDRGMESVEAVHGHGGKTRVVYIATPSPSPQTVTTVAELTPAHVGMLFRGADGVVYEAGEGRAFYVNDFDNPWVPYSDPDFQAEAFPATVLAPASPPPSEVRVTGEQVEAAARAIYEASAHGDSEDMARAAFAAAGIPVAGEESP